jgi:hypothetical protein
MLTSPDMQGFWYHFVETVYGAWLYGDARGFRTRHHREHVEGDYKNPPPLEMYQQKRQQSENSLKQQPVEIAAEWRPTIAAAVRDRLDELGCFVLCLAQSGQHLHLLAKLPAEADPRIIMGLAKKHAAFEAKAKGWKGKLWAKRGKEMRVRDRRHQLNAYRYILDHEEEGAWVWQWKHDQASEPTDSRPWAWSRPWTWR